MKILVISPRVPYSRTDGAWLCVYNVLKPMAARHDIYLFSFYEGTYDKQWMTDLEGVFTEVHLMKKEKPKRSIFRYIKNALSWDSGLLMREQYPEDYFRFKKKMEGLILSKKIDLIQAVLVNMADFAGDVKGCAKVLHLIDSNTLKFKREIALQNTGERIRNIHKLISYYRFRAFEKNAMQKYDVNITVGEKDYEILKKLSPNANIALIPNGVNTELFYELPEEPSEYPILVFSGNMKFPPNIDAVTYFYHKIFPFIREKAPDVRFFVVGASPSDDVKKLADDRNVVVTGFVDDMHAYLVKADIVICPMRMGGGIKNKILEAMASGRAVVSSSVGAEGLNVTHGENILIEDSVNGFADSVLKLLGDKSFRERLARNGRELISKHYTWDICSKKYEDTYKEILKKY